MIKAKIITVSYDIFQAATEEEAVVQILTLFLDIMFSYKVSYALFPVLPTSMAIIKWTKCQTYQM